MASPNERVGARLGRLLGLDIPPSRWVSITEPIEAARQRCLSASGVDPGPIAVASAEDEMRVADPGGFETLFGYGLTLAARNDINRAAEVVSVGLDKPSDSIALTTARCDRTLNTAAVLAPYSAPAAVHSRVAELTAQSEDTGEYISLQATWRACMKAAGFDVAGIDSVQAQQVVAGEAQRLSGPQKSDGSDEAPYALSDDQLRELASFELLVFASDQSCQRSVGLYGYRLDIEDNILDALHKEFPNFAGVAK
jgi:hypothetical protein